MFNWNIILVETQKIDKFFLPFFLLIIIAKKRITVGKVLQLFVYPLKSADPVEVD